MKRRGFLQSLAGLVGVAVAPTLPAKTKSTIVNAKPGVYINGKKVEPPINAGPATIKTSATDFGWLTIDDFGAKDTINLGLENVKLIRSDVDSLILGTNWKAPASLFPNEATFGDAFFFQPRTYRTYPLDQATIGRLEGCYIYTETGWKQFLGLAKTEDIDWDQINQKPDLFPPAPYI